MTYENFTQTEIGGVPIGNLPGYISDKVNMVIGKRPVLEPDGKGYRSPSNSTLDYGEGV